MDASASVDSSGDAGNRPSISALISRFRYSAPSAPSERMAKRGEIAKQFWWLDEAALSSVHHSVDSEVQTEDSLQLPRDSYDMSVDQRSLPPPPPPPIMPSKSQDLPEEFRVRSIFDLQKLPGNVADLIEAERRRIQLDRSRGSSSTLPSASYLDTRGSDSDDDAVDMGDSITDMKERVYDRAERLLRHVYLTSDRPKPHVSVSFASEASSVPPGPPAAASTTASQQSPRPVIDPGDSLTSSAEIAEILAQMRAEYILSDDEDDDEDAKAVQRRQSSIADGRKDRSDQRDHTPIRTEEVHRTQQRQEDGESQEEATGIAVVTNRLMGLDGSLPAVLSPLPPLRNQCETPAKPLEISAEPPLTVTVDAPPPPVVYTAETDASLSIHSSLSSSFPLHSSQPPSATSAQASAALMYLSSSSETGGLLSMYHQQQQALQRRREVAGTKRPVDWDAKSRHLETLVSPHLAHDALVRQLWERWQELHSLRRAAVEQQQRRQQPRR